MNKVRIVSAITSAAGITLYLKDGRTIELPATGWKTKSIMDKITRPLAQHKTVEIDLDEFSLERRVEERTGGIIRFLRKKWSDFTGMFGGTLPDGAVAEAETTVAVMNGKEIPGMEKIEKQIEYAAFEDAKGFTRFMERLTKVIDQRGHTVQELLDFISKGDLPISDDGYIVAYKSLFRRDGHFVDPHTQTVKQRVGSRVSMEVNLVDPNRRNECSYGLHVGRRAYMGSFSGDVMTLIIIDPADVVAVPLKDPNKMRVAAYHIIGELSEQGRFEVRANRPMTTVEADAKLLAGALRGKHVGILEEVRVGKTGILIQTVGRKVEVETVAEAAKTLDDIDANKGAVTVKDVQKVVQEAVAERETAREAANRRKREKRAAAKTVKPETVSAAPAKAKKAVKPGDLSHVPEKWRDAYAAVKSGQMSQREAEKIYHISAKKLRALLRENGDL